MEAGSATPQFDAFLGGEHVFPPVINVKDFCKNRMEEILMLTEALKESPFRGQAFQRLPKHMRRRQMSHYIKRLPRRLRNSFSSMREDPPPPPKRPSRKYRRRPKNLLLEYNRRQRENVWLETHIWHSKRFHMTSKWGYRLPEKSCSKSYRACYRAAAQHCFLHDMSYFCVIELKGLQERLLQGLQQCVSSKCGLTFGARMYQNGLRKGSLTLYHPNSFPYGAIGHVSFLWRPVEEEGSDRVIWILLHPALHDEVIDMLMKLFEMHSVDIPETLPPPQRLPVKAIEMKDKQKRNIPFRRTPKYITDDGSLTMTLLKDTFNVFRLTGPLSLAVVSTAFDMSLLRPGDSEASKVGIVKSSLKRSYTSTVGEDQAIDSAKKMKMEVNEVMVEETSPVNTPWWRNFYASPTTRECLEKQERFYMELTSLTSPGELPPRMILSLLVTDPRLTIPCKRTKAVPKSQKAAERIPCQSLDAALCRSPLWLSEVRDEVADVKMSTAEINALRAKLIVPGSEVRHMIDDDKRARIPLLLLHRPGQEQSDFGNGFDVIVPGGWAMPVWLSLVYRGARTAGLRESEALVLEGNSLQEQLQPDSRAGDTESVERYRKLRAEYFKRPPNKRANFAKLGIQSPFCAPWRVLVRDWRLHPEKAEHEKSDGGSEERFYVLRDAKKLSELRDMSKNLVKALRKSKASEDFRFDFGSEDMNCLVPVAVECVGKGTMKDFAMICLPAAEDWKREKEQPVEEGTHADENARERKTAREEHAKLVKSLRRKRRRKRKQEKEEKGEDSACEVADPKLEEYNRRMEDLWLGQPETLKSVVHSCSRTIIGYIVLGGYSYVRARGCGLGYVALKGFLHFMKKCHEDGTQPLVLFRNPTCSVYRFGKLKVCMS